MRSRLAFLVSLLIALAAVAVPATAAADPPQENHGLTINATPNPTDAGERVYIYGQLNDPPVGGQTIILYRHRDGTDGGFTPVATTTTKPNGFYSFIRTPVDTNREWFVRERGDLDTHSRTIHEGVRALVSIHPSTTNTTTSHPVTFTGKVTPDHTGETVLLQEHNQAGDDWHTIKTGRLDDESRYSITYRWASPGDHSVRVVLPGDARNNRGYSDEVDVTVQQAQVADFTIMSSSPKIPEGQTAKISGVLYQPDTTTPEPNTSVTLWGRSPGEDHFRALQSVLTGKDGSYRFTVMPTVNTIYQVRTTFKPHRHSANLFEGVHDVVSLTPSATSSTVGGHVTFQGNVSPDKAGHLVYLQRLGPDGDWHTVKAAEVTHSSTFRFTWSFNDAGSHTFRARISSDPKNLGGASDPVTITVTGP